MSLGLSVALPRHELTLVVVLDQFFYTEPIVNIAQLMLYYQLPLSSVDLLEQGVTSELTSALLLTAPSYPYKTAFIKHLTQ